jgi:hypothetical protein
MKAQTRQENVRFGAEGAQRAGFIRWTALGSDKVLRTTGLGKAEELQKVEQPFGFLSSLRETGEGAGGEGKTNPQKPL